MSFVIPDCHSLEKENHSMENKQVVWYKDYVEKNTWR